MERKCVVCGSGSHRTDWVRVSGDGKFVACDNHSEEVFNNACAAAVSNSVNNKPVAAPAAPTPPVVEKPAVQKPAPVFGLGKKN